MFIVIFGPESVYHLQCLWNVAWSSDYDISKPHRAALAARSGPYSIATANDANTYNRSELDYILSSTSLMMTGFRDRTRRRIVNSLLIGRADREMYC